MTPSNPFAGLCTLLLAWVLLSAATSTSYELSLAANRPPCEAPANPSTNESTKPAPRCRGTKGERTTFNVRPNTMLWFEQTQPAPVAFVFAGPLAVEPFAYPTPALGIGINERASGLVVEAVYGLQRREQSIAFDQWVRVHLPPHTSFWIQVKRGT